MGDEKEGFSITYTDGEDYTYTVDSSDTITLDDTFTSNGDGTFTINLNNTIDDSTFTYNPNEYVYVDDSIKPERVETMCKHYPGLEKAWRNFKAVYDMCEQDYKGKLKELGLDDEIPF